MSLVLKSRKEKDDGTLSEYNSVQWECFCKMNSRIEI